MAKQSRETYPWVSISGGGYYPHSSYTSSTSDPDTFYNLHQTLRFNKKTSPKWIKEFVTRCFTEKRIGKAILEVSIKGTFPTERPGPSKQVVQKKRNNTKLVQHRAKRYGTKKKVQTRMAVRSSSARRRKEIMAKNRKDE